MTYKSLSLVVTDKATDQGVLTVAKNFAERTGAHLDIYCLGVDPARYEPLPAGSAAVLIESGAAEARENAEALRAWVNERIPSDMAKVGIDLLVLPHIGLDAGLGRLLRFSDLIFAPRPYGDDAGPLQVQTLESALFGTGAPVLVVPPGMTDFPSPKRVLVAWDESDESLAAVRAAMPLLEEAESVHVVMVDPPSRRPDRSDPGGALGHMLARHGVRTDIAILSRTMPKVSDLLNRYVSDHECDLIVMGGYGHSRVREALLGGPTRDMLEDMSVPVLMAR